MFTTNFIGFEVRNTGNSDGYVLLGEQQNEHLGNYSTLEDAKRMAVIQYMYNRPNLFKTHITRRALYGRPTFHEFFTLKKSLLADGFEEVLNSKEVEHSNDGNYGIVVCGQELWPGAPVAPKNKPLVKLLTTIDGIMSTGLHNGTPLHLSVKRQLEYLSNEG